jgi:hypothetical protein
MTRRAWLAAMLASSRAGASTVAVPIHRIVDARARCAPETLRRFWGEIWPQALVELGRGGLPLQVEDGAGEMRRSAGDRPIFVGLRRDVLNLVLTDYIPMNWDEGRALAGVTLIYDGYPLCLIAMRYARPNQVPFLSVNTVVHELLHAFFGDIFVARPKWYQASGREWRTDSYATRLWLFHEGAAIRDAAREFLARLNRGRS